MVETGEEPRRWRWFLPVLLLSTTASKLALVWRFPGFLTGDDTEVVETAAKYAVGLVYQPWEIRSLFHPLVLAAPVVWLGARAGLRDPHWLTFLAATPTVAFSAAGVAIFRRLAAELGANAPAARAATFLFAFHWLPFAFGSTQFPRPISTTLLLAAFLLVARDGAPRTLAAAAGVLASLAFVVRWSEAVVLAPLSIFAWRRTRDRWAPAVLLAGFAAGAAVLAGLFDAATWERPFASLSAFVRLTRDPSLGGFVPRPWYWYGSMLLQWAGPVLVVLVLAAWPDPWSRAPLAIAVSLVVIFSLSPVKQPRYLQICVPFLCLAAGAGWERLRAGGNAARSFATILLVASASLGIERSFHLLRGKSASAVAAARFLASSLPAPRRVVLEQAWAYGDRLYLGSSAAIRDLPPRAPLPATEVLSAADGFDAVCLYAADVDAALRRALAAGGWAPCARFQHEANQPVTVYLPAAAPCPRAGGE